MKFIYSKQASVLLSNMATFNKEEFEKWFVENVSIGSSTILEFILYKEKVLKGKIILPK